MPKYERVRRSQSWHELIWRMAQIRDYLERAHYYPIRPGGPAQYCDAAPIFEIMELKLTPDYFGAQAAPSGATTSEVYQVRKPREPEEEKVEWIDNRPTKKPIIRG